MKEPTYKALLDRPLTVACWRGALAVDGDWLTDGRVCFSACHVIGPYIARAEKLGKIKAKDDRIRGQEEVDRLMDAVENSPKAMFTAIELGWRREHIEVSAKKKLTLDVYYVRGPEKVFPLLADYVRLLKSFVDYDEVRVPEFRDRPVGFYRRNELVAICTPLALP